MTERPAAAVEVAGGVKTFRRGPETIRAVDGLTLTVEAGETIVISGPSGSGKSTLFDLLLGWQQADTGEVTVRAEDRPGSIGVITQNLALFDELTAGENASIAASADDGLVDELLHRLELTELRNRLVSELSLGQQQRVAVARALAARPSIVVADEPTSHQDAERARLVMDELRQAAAGGAAVLLTSHDPRIIELADRTIELRNGRIVTESSDAGSARLDEHTAQSAPEPRSTRRPPGTVPFVAAVLLLLVALVFVLLVA